MKLRTSLGILAALLGGCASASRVGTTDDGLTPSGFATRESADQYVQHLFAGGRVDEVTLGREHYLVLFQHGSGIPVVGFAQVYRRDGGRWKWVAKASVPQFEFSRAESANGTIVAVGQTSRLKTLLYDPAKN